MNSHVRRRFWVEVTVAGLIATLAVLTVVWPDWFEAVSGTGPDNGDGSFEWAITFALAVVALVVAVFARWEWRRPRLVTS